MSLELPIAKVSFKLRWSINKNSLTFLTKNKKQELFYNNFFEDLKDKVIDSKAASIIIGKYLVHQKITKDDEYLLKQQVYYKIITIGISFMMLPGARFLIPLLMKFLHKKGINLMPSNVDSNQKK